MFCLWNSQGNSDKTSQVSIGAVLNCLFESRPTCMITLVIHVNEVSEKCAEGLHTLSSSAGDHAIH